MPLCMAARRQRMARRAWPEAGRKRGLASLATFFSDLSGALERITREVLPSPVAFVALPSGNVGGTVRQKPTKADG